MTTENQSTQDETAPLSSSQSPELPPQAPAPEAGPESAAAPAGQPQIPGASTPAEHLRETSEVASPAADAETAAAPVGETNAVPAAAATSTEGTATSPAASVENTAPTGVETAGVETAGVETAGVETAGVETAGVPETDTSADAAPSRKFQLRPIGSEMGKAVPSLGESSVAGDVPADRAESVEVESAEVEQPRRPTPPPPPREAVPIPQAEDVDAAIQAAIDAALAANEIPESPNPEGAAAAIDIETLQPGQKLRGLVQGVHGDSVFIDVGLRMTVAVPFRQFDVKKPPQVGEEVEVAFEKVDDAEGLILANLPRGTTVVKGGDWSSVSPDQVVECVVTKTNKGGLEATVGSLRGFIPASQVELGYVADLEPYVGQKLRVRVTEVKPAKKKLVLSRKALLAEERQAAKGQLMEELKPDQTRTGVVKTIKEYGAFVDLGGVDGFLPIAQMSWVRITHPSEVLQEGQEIEVKVLSIDRDKDRISLGMRQLAPNPWRTAEAKYAKGSTVTGRVTRVEAFGAFVELEPGVEGLIHISELEHRRVKRVQEVLNVDDMAEVQVLEVDPKKKRISLSAKALKEKPEPVAQPKDEDFAPGKGQAYQRQRRGDLKGGTGSNTSGGLFGNPTDY